MEQQLLTKIDRAFHLSKIRYEEIRNKLEASDAFNFAQARQDYFNDPIPSTQVLLSQIFEWRKKRSLKYEIDNNAGVISNYRQAYGFFLSRQYALISSFTKALEIYFNNNELADHLINALQSEDGQKLNRADFILAIELYYITIFELVEDSIHQYDPDYKKRLDKDDYSLLQENPFISLDYGTRNNEIITSLFNMFNGKEFKCTFEEFEGLFKPGSFGEKKIIWHSTEPKLTLLLKGNFDTEGLRTRNKDILEVATQRLLNKNGKSYVVEQLRVVATKAHLSTTIVNSEQIIKFLKKTNN